MKHGLTLYYGFECSNTSDEQYNEISLDDADDTKIEAARLLYDNYVNGQFFDADIFNSLIHWLRSDTNDFHYESDNTVYFIEESH